MKEQEPDLTQRIAGRIRELRADQKLSLDDLARRSGVSRSMISFIERGESSPTAVILEKLAAGLGVTLASLFDPPAAQTPGGPLVRRADQVEWQDPASGYVRRNITPPGPGQPMQIVEIHFPAGQRVAFENVRERPVFQQIWMMKGEMTITLGTECQRLHTGDCLAVVLNRPHMFHNPTRKPAHYAVVITTDPATSR
jgi:transcriptional regulator with XRE-family HTH domain